MNRYVIDAYAWIEYLIGSEAGERVRTVLEDENTEVYTCAVTVAEVISKTAREGRDFDIAYEVITSNSDVIDVDEELSKETGILHAGMRKTRRDFGLADAYLLAVARRSKSEILTGDVHFRDIKESVLVK